MSRPAHPALNPHGYSAGSLVFNLLLAALAGIVTIVAPCTLPVPPILFGASIGQTSRLRPVFIAGGFVIAFSIVALALTALTRVFDFDPNVLREAATILLAIFGLLTIWPAPFEWLSIRLAGVIPASGASTPRGREGQFGGVSVRALREQRAGRTQAPRHHLSCREG